MRALRSCCLAVVLCVLWSSGAAASAPGRTKPGSIYIRGIATQVSPHGFTLQTTHRGTYSVSTQAATQITETGASGHLQIHDGDHLGVSGFVSGRSIRAIRIRIYPTKPKPYELRGTVVAVGSGHVTVSVGSSRLTVVLKSNTTVSVGRVSGSTSQIHAGARVRMRVERVNGNVVALSIYVYVNRPALVHVRLQGTVRSVVGGRIVIATTSGMATVTVTSQTSIRLGIDSVGPSALHPGQTVTVSACCQGQPLVATSIRIAKTKTARTTYEVRGQVTGVRGTQLQITSGGRRVTIMLTSATAVQIGSGTARVQDIRVGDAVTVRAYQSGNALIATRVHVLAASRQVRSIRATVVAVGNATITVLDQGKRYVVAVGSSVVVTLNGTRVSLSALRPGDRIALQVQGAATPLKALHAAATRAATKQVTVRGTVGQVTSGGVVIVDGAGGRHPVRLAAGVHALLNGSAAPASALFPGVKARARGTVAGGTLIASSLTISVTSRTVHGRVVSAASSHLVLSATAGRRVRADLLPGEFASDGKSRLAPGSLASGVYLRVTGWVEATDRLRATAIAVEHPVVSIAATVVSTTGGLTVATSAGTRYQLRLGTSVQIVASHVQIALKAAEIPVGAHVHVDGTVDASGRLLVTTMMVRLSSVTLEGQITEAVLDWTLSTSSGTYDLRVQQATPVTQGTHALTLDDIVPGDSVTVYGYALAQSSVLVRKIEVHRKLEGLDGTVAALNPDAFVLQSADGQHRVITSVSTVFSGTSATIALGQSVHVTGYLRGDGAILATRVRILKSK